MKDTIDTMLINEKIIRIYSFYPFSSWNTRKMLLLRKILTKTSQPTPRSPTYGEVKQWNDGLKEGYIPSYDLIKLINIQIS